MNSGRRQIATLVMRVTICAFATSVSLVALARARSATIENTASLTYRNGDLITTVTSNSVSTDVLITHAQPTLAFLTPGSGAGVVQIPVSVGCGGAGGSDQMVALVPSFGVIVGAPIFIVVNDAAANINPGQRDTVQVKLTLGPDAETVTLTETASDSGLFGAWIATSPDSDTSATRGDCSLDFSHNALLLLGSYATPGSLGRTAHASLARRIDNIVFDTSSGLPVNGAIVAIVDAVTGQASAVTGIDGTSAFPSTVVSGTSAVDTFGRLYKVANGGFVFPNLKPGTYRLSITPPGSLSYPTVSALGDFSGVMLSIGRPASISSGSLGQPFIIANDGSLSFDVPLDEMISTVVVAVTTSVARASSGDYVQYRVAIQKGSTANTSYGLKLFAVIPAGFRYEKGSFRVNGVSVTEPVVGTDGLHLTATLPASLQGRDLVVTYVTQVTTAAPAGDAIDTAYVTTGLGRPSNTAVATVQVTTPLFSDAVTIIGRVVSDACTIDSPSARPVPNVRIMLEDGTFVVSDDDGQYHIENVRPGLHVIQIDRNSLPTGFHLVKCSDDTRRGGSAMSQFVDARGGTLWRADFFLDREATATAAIPEVPTTVASNEAAAGAQENWIDQADGSNSFLFPLTGHNPRSPTLRVVVAHGGSSTVVLRVNGVAVDELAYDGTTVNPSKTAAVDVWNGILLQDGDNTIEAVVSEGGSIVATLRTSVAYVNSADHGEYLPDKSRLGADGRINPIIAVRILDRSGRPVRAGLSGRLDVSAPYETIEAAEARRQSKLATLGSASNNWRVTGDDGIAYIELAPTTQTGEVTLDLHLRENAQSLVRQTGQIRSVLDRRDQIRAWLVPGRVDWVVVGFAAGSAGYTTITQQAETLGSNSQDTGIVDGQVKLYAKGRIKGKWLLTLAYDSDKASDRKRRQSILSNIDPDAYYTLYGDAALQGYDAQSSRTVFLKIESDRFYALFGDFATNFNDSELGRYNRVLTGLKGQYHSTKTAFSAFAATTDFRHQRDEIQGLGLTGPYLLQRRDMVPNTDRIVIETRDRDRPELIVETRELVRYIDYNVDRVRGTVTLKEPLPSRDFRFNPNFLIVDYDVDSTATVRSVAGARVTQSLAGGRAVLGITALHNDDEQRRTLGAVDALLVIDRSTQAHLETGLSTAAGLGVAHAFIAEVQHRSATLDAKIYLREQSLDFGVGQQNAFEAGTRRIGADGQMQVSADTTVGGEAYLATSLTSAAARSSIKAEARTRQRKTEFAASVLHVEETDALGEGNATTQFGLSTSRTIFDGRLTINGDLRQSIDGRDSVTTPSRYQIGTAFKLTDKVRLLASHEIATGGTATAANTRVGFDYAPWQGTTVTSGVEGQRLGENGNRVIGAFGATQRFQINKLWTADFALESNRTLAGVIGAANVIDSLHPPAIGGRVENGRLDSNFTSVSGALGYRGTDWSWTGRAEGRLGTETRLGLTTSAIRQLEAGKVYGGILTLYRSTGPDQMRSDHSDAAFSLALRPPTSRFQLLEKLEFIVDDASRGSGIVIAAAPSLFADKSDVASAATRIRSAKLINNLALNWIAAGDSAGSRTQISVYYGSKYVRQSFDGQIFGGYTDIISIEGRHDLATWLDVGLQAGARHAWGAGNWQWSLGPTIGVSPAKNIWISLGYNISGFEDRDFSGARATIAGPWIAFRLKFDETSLGLARDNR